MAGKDKLKQLKVNVGAGGDPIQIVTNAPNVVEGCHLIVATVGSFHLPSDVSSVCVFVFRGGSRYDSRHTLTFFLCGTAGSKVTMNGEEIEIKEATVCNIYRQAHANTHWSKHMKYIWIPSNAWFFMQTYVFCCMLVFDLM